MNYRVEAAGTTPAYMQLYTQVRADIVDGTFRFGSKLPSKRLLAEETGVSVITVEHAYAILCEEGYAEARERKGYFVIYRERDFGGAPPAAPAALPHSGHALSAGSGFPFSVLARTMRRVLLDMGEEILVKSPNHGCPALRAAVAAYLARQSGIHVRPEQVIVGSGAEYLYGLVIQLLGRDRVVALEDPCYEKIRRVYEANGVRCERLRLGADGIESAALEQTAATVLHITPFHSFPSGVTASASKRREYLRWAGAREGYIVEDNYDSELTVSRKNEDTVFALSGEENVIYLNTFSRTVAPSVRVGYMLLPPTLLPVFEQRLGFYSCTVPVFEQYVLAELLDSGDFERHIHRVRRQKRRERAAVQEHDAAIQK